MDLESTPPRARATARRVALLLGMAGLAAACQPGDPQETVPANEARPFDFATTRSATAGVLVRADEGAPLGGAVVTVRRPDTAAEPGVLGRAVTGADGRAVMVLALRLDDGELEVVIDKRGYAGPYTDPERRTQLGAFAPASWTLMPADGIDDVAVVLAKE